MATNDNRKIIKKIPWHVMLLSIFPLLAFFVNNIHESTISMLLRPAIFSIAIGALIFGLVFLIVKHWEKAGLITAMLEFIIFSYGHFYHLVQGQTLFGFAIGRHRYLLAFSVILFILVVWIIIRALKDYTAVSKILNIVFSVMVLVQIIRIANYEIQSALVMAKQNSSQANTSKNLGAKDKRDVFFILLDGYMRSDWLLDNLGYDNSELISSLEENGFYIATCSRSNYSFTRLSMTSEFNMNYLDEIFDEVPKGIYIQDRLRQSEVRKNFSNFDYNFITFENFYPWLNITDSDQFIKPAQVSRINRFDIMFLETTIFTVPYNLYERKVMEYQWSPEHEDTTRYATLVQFILDYLKAPPKKEEPKFVYAHILSPHYPYVFNADGSINYDWKDNPEESLRATYTFLNNEIVEIVKSLKELNPEPIIIIQSDHGLGETNYKHLILNAYYLPDGGEELLYPTISPVNSFRLIFTEYFGMEYPLLEDQSYHSEKENGEDMILVKDPYSECQITDH